jgi:hypothetical protein
MIPFSAAFPVYAFAAAVLLAFLLVALDAFALALWRRWLGGWGGDFPRSIKVTALCLFLGAQYVAAVWPDLFPGAWSLPAAQAAPWAYARVALAWAGLPVVLAGVCLWFVSHHNNGGPQGTGGPERYGLAGYGYPIAYPFRALIPDVRIFGSVAIRATTWTAFGELWLGGVTGIFVGLALAPLIAYRVFLALSFHLSF